MNGTEAARTLESGASMEQLKAYPTVGVCGLDCGLCPRYYTAGPSRCPGCGGPGFSEKHPSCSFITCCVKKKGLEACGECADFPCAKFKSDEEYRQVPLSSSYPPYRRVLSNLYSIRESGIKEHAKRLDKRIGLLRAMVEHYDDGRSKSFFCRAAALLSPEVLHRSLDQADRATRGRPKSAGKTPERASTFRAILSDAACTEGIDLRAKK